MSWGFSLSWWDAPPLLHSLEIIGSFCGFHYLLRREKRDWTKVSQPAARIQSHIIVNHNKQWRKRQGEPSHWPKPSQVWRAVEMWCLSRSKEELIATTPFMWTMSMWIVCTCDTSVRAVSSAWGCLWSPMVKAKIFNSDGSHKIPPPESVWMRFAAVCSRSDCVDVSEPVRWKVVLRDAGRSLIFISAS